MATKQYVAIAFLFFFLFSSPQFKARNRLTLINLIVVKARDELGRANDHESSFSRRNRRILLRTSVVSHLSDCQKHFIQNVK